MIADLTCLVNALFNKFELGVFGAASQAGPANSVADKGLPAATKQISGESPVNSVPTSRG